MVNAWITYLKWRVEFVEYRSNFLSLELLLSKGR